MTTITEVVEERIIYVAEDGKRFNSSWLCQLYEEYLQIHDEVMKEFQFFAYDFEKQMFVSSSPADANYAIVNDTQLKEYRQFLKGDYSQLGQKGFYYRSYANAYNGNSGPNGWFFVADLPTCKKIAEFCNQLKIGG